MEEVGGFLAGERDYKNLKGGTGPLVYPAGFVYLYSFLKKLTAGSVRPAQWCFAGVYLATHAVVLWLYIKSKVVPPLALALLSLSKRLHSIYLLRCFNDGAAMLLAWLATLLLARALSSRDEDERQKSSKKKNSRGKQLLVVASVATFSLAVSVKMNVLLMAPPVAVLLLQAARVPEIALAVVSGVALQLLLGLPFLSQFPGSYLNRAFELGRVFTHKWSVNFAFLSEEAFVSKPLALSLAVAHLGVLLAFAGWRWTKKEGKRSGDGGGLVAAALGCWDASFSKSKSKSPRPALAPAHVFHVVAMGNFIGVVFARSLHYQASRKRRERESFLFHFRRLPNSGFFSPLLSLTSLSLSLSLSLSFFPSSSESKKNSSPPVLLLVRPLHPAPAVVHALPPGAEARPLARGRGRMEQLPAVAARVCGAVGGALAFADRPLGRSRGGRKEGEGEKEGVRRAVLLFLFFFFSFAVLLRSR